MPYRTPAPPDAEAPTTGAGALEELIIYGACVAFGLGALVHACVFRHDLGGVGALATLLGGWGARALATRGWRRERA